MADVIASQSDKKDEVVANIILLNHPLFSTLRRLMRVPYKFVVEDIDEFKKWISARGFTEDVFSSDDTALEWFRNEKSNNNIETLTLSNDLFDERGRLIPFTGDRWSDDYVKYSLVKAKKTMSAFDSDLDDDVPF